jgi:hypothetical protein
MNFSILPDGSGGVGKHENAPDLPYEVGLERLGKICRLQKICGKSGL